ncbi:MAG: MtaA/CmuA family methyltransferase [Candidatus Hadarchaeum sp.]|uniref:MtaA/CmuA family methyltransferase n=1 Tax=Candidatus Hadarchaeum sp. TaxID=2883567 RepID=UPI0031700E10
MSFTPKKRVISALLGGRVDRIPATAVCQTATHDQMQAIGVGWPEAHLDADKMAKLASAAYTLTGLETARVPFDQAVEAEALGGRMEIKAEIPAIVGHLNDFSELKIPENFLELGRVPVVLGAVEKLSEKFGDVLPVMAGIIGPFSIATQIFDPSDMLKWTITRQRESSEVLSALVDPLVEYANELTKRGADIIIIEDMFSSQLGSKAFRAVAMEPLKKLVERIKNIVVIHMCGNITKMVSDVVEVGADGLSIAKETDLATAIRSARGKTAIIGNIDPVSDLMLKGSSAVEAAVRAAIDGGVDLVAPGCSLAPATPMENIKQMVLQVQRYGGRVEAVAPREVDLGKIFTKYGVVRAGPPIYESLLPVVAELADVAKAVVRGDSAAVEAAVRAALEKLEPLRVISDGLTAGMTIVSKMWEDGVYFLPEVVNAADAMQAGISLCEKKMGRAATRKAKIITHVAEGDIHDIGKNIVSALLNANGFEVIDLGRDVPVERVVEETKKNKPLLVMGTALMTTTMTAFPKLVERLKQEGLSTTLACGGGAVNQEYVETFENSVFGDKAVDAVKIAELALKGLSWREIRGRVHK